MTIISDGQLFALNRLIGKFAPDRPKRLFVLGKLLNKEVKSSTELTLENWRYIRDKAYPAWMKDDWTINEAFTGEVRGFVKQYEKEVLGQKELFE